MKDTTKRLFFCYTFLISSCMFAQEYDYKTFEKNTMQGTKVGITNKKTGKEVLPAVYDNVFEYENERFFVQNNGKIGVIDTTGKIIIPFQYDDVAVKDDRAFLRKSGKWAMFNYQAGVAMTTFQYDEVLGYEDGIARVAIAGKQGYVDKFGKQILSCKFTEGYDCYGEFILVYEKVFVSTGYEYVTKNVDGDVINRQDIGSSDKLPIVFNKQGKIIYKGVHGERVKFCNGKSVFIVEGAMGSYTEPAYHKIVDAFGSTIIPYSTKYKFEPDKNWIRIDAPTGKGILGFDAKVLLNPNFANISDYTYNNDTLAKVSFKNDSFFYIDINAKCVEFSGVKCPE